jgi:hypothetical protein
MSPRTKIHNNMKHEEILNLVKSEISHITCLKKRNQKTEIIMPFATITSKFVSVFVEKEGNEFIIHDNGWLFDGNYFSEDLFIEKDVIEEAQKYFDVEVVDMKKCFVLADNQALVAQIFELCNFIQFVVNQNQIYHSMYA